MPGLMIMLPLAVLIALSFLGFFLWSVFNGDYEDIEMQKYRVLMDDQDDIDLAFHRETTGQKIDSAARAQPTNPGKVKS